MAVHRGGPAKVRTPIAGPDHCKVRAVNKRSKLTPPSLGRSMAWLADRRRNPMPINNLMEEPVNGRVGLSTRQKTRWSLDHSAGSSFAWRLPLVLALPSVLTCLLSRANPTNPRSLADCAATMTSPQGARSMASHAPTHEQPRPASVDSKALDAPKIPGRSIPGG